MIRVLAGFLRFPADNKNHAPGGTPERDSGVVEGNLIMVIYLATKSRLGKHVRLVYCPLVQPPAEHGLHGLADMFPCTIRDQRQFTGTNLGAIVAVVQFQAIAPETTVTGLRLTVSPLSTLPGATCLNSTVMIPVVAAAVTLDT